MTIEELLEIEAVRKLRLQYSFFLDAGDLDALVELFAERRKGKEAEVSPVIQVVFGWRPTSFADFAQRSAAIFRGERPAPKV